MGFQKTTDEEGRRHVEIRCEWPSRQEDEETRKRVQQRGKKMKDEETEGERGGERGDKKREGKGQQRIKELKIKEEEGETRLK